MITRGIKDVQPKDPDFSELWISAWCIKPLFQLRCVVVVVHARGDISNPDTADNRENIVERGGGGEEVTDSQYDKGYGDGPNKIFFHIL